MESVVEGLDLNEGSNNGWEAVCRSPAPERMGYEMAVWKVERKQHNGHLVYRLRVKGTGGNHAWQTAKDNSGPLWCLDHLASAEGEPAYTGGTCVVCDHRLRGEEVAK